MSYYVKRLRTKSALVLVVSLESVHFGFAMEVTMYFRNSIDAVEMYELLYKYMRTHQAIETYQIMSAYEYIRAHETE